MGSTEPIREEDVQHAIMEYCRAGGCVRQLPPAKTPQRNGVGDTWGMYESLRETWVQQDA